MNEIKKETYLVYLNGTLEIDGMNIRDVEAQIREKINLSGILVLGKKKEILNI